MRVESYGEDAKFSYSLSGTHVSGTLITNGNHRKLYCNITIRGTSVGSNEVTYWFNAEKGEIQVILSAGTSSQTINGYYFVNEYCELIPNESWGRNSAED